MYKMVLKICKAGHLKLFETIQLRLMIPPVSLPGISSCLRNGLHEECIICPQKHFKSNEGLILIIYQHIWWLQLNSFNLDFFSSHSED